MSAGWEYVVDEVNGGDMMRRRMKLESGDTAEMDFWCVTDDAVVISFAVYTKRNKKFPDDKRQTTGRDGLVPIAFALESLEQVEHTSWINRVYVGWEDPRRQEIYTRVLGKRGYDLTTLERRTVLTKHTAELQGIKYV